MALRSQELARRYTQGYAVGPRAVTIADVDDYCDWARSNPDAASAAGLMRHRRRNETPCSGCYAARRRADKRTKSVRSERSKIVAAETEQSLDQSSVVAVDESIQLVPALEELARCLRVESIRKLPDARIVREYRATLEDLHTARGGFRAVVAPAEDENVTDLAARRRRRVAEKS